MGNRLFLYWKKSLHVWKSCHVRMYCFEVSLNLHATKKGLKLSL